jgi:hypothetical protein
MSDMTASTNFLNSGLKPIEHGVAPSGPDELVVLAILDQSAAIDRDNTICMAYRGKTVSNDDDGPPLGDLFHIFLDDALAFVVQRARGLVKDQDAWVGD